MPRGSFRAQLVKPDGRVETAVEWRSNLFVKRGSVLLALAAMGRGFPALAAIALGNPGNPSGPTVNDTGLEAEYASEGLAIARKAVDTIFYDPDNETGDTVVVDLADLRMTNKLQLQATFGVGQALMGIREAGVFGGHRADLLSGGLCVCRAVLAEPFDKAAEDSLVWTWLLEF